MINKIEFKAKNLTSNAGLFLMLENTKNNGIFEKLIIVRCFVKHIIEQKEIDNLDSM